MNEEEKEAIEELNEILKQWQQIINIENEEEREIEMSLYFEEMPFNDIQIALNLIENLQKENEELKEELDYYKQREKQDFDERDYYEE